MLWLLVLFVVCVYGQFEVPDALVEPLSPKGFRVSIPGKPSLINVDKGHYIFQNFPEIANISFFIRSRRHQTFCLSWQNQRRNEWKGRRYLL